MVVHAYYNLSWRLEDQTLKVNLHCILFKAGLDYVKPHLMA